MLLCVRLILTLCADWPPYAFLCFPSSGRYSRPVRKTSAPNLAPTGSITFVPTLSVASAANRNGASRCCSVVNALGY